MILNINNAFEFLQKHEKYCWLYSSQLKKDIDFISSLFYEFNFENKNHIKNIHFSIIERIISNEKLKLISEDQLLSFINNLYQNDRSYFRLYEYVYFSTVSSSKYVRNDDHISRIFLL